LNFIDRFSKNNHIKLHENLSLGSSVVPCRRTDRHDETIMRFSSILRMHLKLVLCFYKVSFIVFARDCETTSDYFPRQN